MGINKYNNMIIYTLLSVQNIKRTHFQTPGDILELILNVKTQCI